MNFIPLTTHLSAFLEASSSRHCINIDGASLSLPDVIAVARHNVSTVIDESTRTRVQASRDVLQEKLDAQVSIYGVSTGFGGSASTRTQDHLGLGLALFQMQHCGIMSSSSSPDQLFATTMPESWVRAAILVRINSLVRGHSGVRWELPHGLQQLLAQNITPLVPLRGSISASGDLSPLSYIAGTLMGNPSVKAYHTCPQSGQRTLTPSHVALAQHNLSPLIIQAKEHLGLLNGTAFSAAAASLVLYDAVQLAFLTQVCTAMATEALLGSRGSFMPFVNDVARPHPGQIDVAKTVLALLDGSKLAQTPQSDIHMQEDKGTLKQDRYALRTSPQFIGPQVEDIHSALLAVTQELNSTTDNPLIESATKMVHDTGNFQAMAVTNAMEKTRLALHHLGKILFAQTTEIMNPDTNKGLPPSLASTDPSLNFHCKGVEISLAAYVSEIGFLANPVSTHIQSAEMHNQAVNSLALLSARQTITAADVLTLIVASCIYSSCQALDLRALQLSLVEGFQGIISRITTCHFWTKEPFIGSCKNDIPKDLHHRHRLYDERDIQVENEKTTLAGSSSSATMGVIGSGADDESESKARDSLLDSDHFFFPSDSAALEDEVVVAAAAVAVHRHISPEDTSSPPMCIAGNETKVPHQAQGTASTEPSREPDHSEPASCDLLASDAQIQVESQTVPDPDIDIDGSESISDGISASSSESGDANSSSDDNDDDDELELEEFPVSPSYGSSLTSMTSMASMAGGGSRGDITGNVPGISDTFIRELEKTFLDTFWHSTTMDAEEQVRTAVDSLINRLVQEAFRSTSTSSLSSSTATTGTTANSDFTFTIDLFSLRSLLPAYRASLEAACLDLVTRERQRFLTCPVEDLPTPGLVGLGSRLIHRFVRKELGIGMHGIENLVAFEGGLNSQEPTTGEKISLIYDAIKTGRIQSVLSEIVSSLA